MSPKTAGQIEEASRQSVGPWARAGRCWLSFVEGCRFVGRRSRGWISARWARLRPRPVRSRRLLFLDDDPGRAAIFLKENPDAIWVTTVADCIARLGQPWDEVHLDHDLGGKTFVDSNARDCGMEVIRWLCKEPRTHLKASRFFVHTHHAAAGLLMVLQMHRYGYKAEFRPFGQDLEQMLAHNEPPADLE